MGKYIIKRLIQMLLALVIVSFGVFMIINLIPGTLGARPKPDAASTDHLAWNGCQDDPLLAGSPYGCFASGLYHYRQCERRAA